MTALVDKLQVGDEHIEIWQYGANDFAVFYRTSNTSCRGTLLQVMQDLNKCFGVFDER